MKTLIFDIESTNLSANFGYILCISYKWLGEKNVHTIRIDRFPLFRKDPTNDREVVKAFGKVYEEADRVVAHYGKKFDKCFLNTRLIVHGFPVLPATKLHDTWRLAKDNLRLNSNRLATLISAFDIPYKKTELNGRIWVKAMAGDKSAIKYVVTHCISDVLALEAVYLKLIPFITETENPALHKCNKKYLRRNGTRVMNKKTYVRLYCVKCGGWFKGDLDE